MNRWLLRRRMAVLSAMVLVGLLASHSQAAAPAKTVVDVTYYFLPG